MSERDQKRIYLWVMPRSLSTAFLRAMMSRDGCRGFAEPFVYSYYMSADRLSDRYSREEYPDRPGATFRETKARLEGNFEGYKEVFVKEEAYRLKPFFEKGTVHSIIPEGYIHTFLIRHPAKTIISWYNGTAIGQSGLKGFGNEMDYEQSVKMHEYVTKTLGQKSIIVDADDLQADPEGILRLYCEAVGIDFQDCMINWKEVPQDLLKELEEWMEWMDTVLKAKGFLKKTPSKLPDLTDVPREVQQCVSDNIPFYEQLFAKRLKLH